MSSARSLDQVPEPESSARRPRGPRAAKSSGIAESSGRSRSSASSAVSKGRSVCDTCKKKKVACDMDKPCSTKQKKLSAVRDELANLLGRVEDLSTKLALSPDDLVDLYEQAYEDLKPESYATDTPPIAKKKKKRPSPLVPGMEESDMPPPLKRRSRAAPPSSPTPAPARFPRAAKSARLSTAALSSCDSPYPASTSRPPYLRPPPLPPIDLSGKVRSGRMYHFPITESTKAPMSFDYQDASIAGDDSCAEDDEGAFFSLVALCGGSLGRGGHAAELEAEKSKAMLTS